MWRGGSESASPALTQASRSSFSYESNPLCDGSSQPFLLGPCSRRLVTQSFPCAQSISVASGFRSAPRPILPALNRTMDALLPEFSLMPLPPTTSHFPSESLTCREGSCAESPKTFDQPCLLTKHKKQHTRPHHCQVPGCKYAEGGDPGGFGQPRDLLNHEKTHQPVPSIHCFIPGCTSSATRHYNMVRHLKTQHGIEMKQAEVAKLCRR